MTKAAQSNTALPKSPTVVRGLDEITNGGLPGLILPAGPIEPFPERGGTMKRPAERRLRAKEPAGAKEGVWELRLYVAGRTPKSVAAFANLERVCKQHLAGRYRIEVIDLTLTPQLAARDQIVAVPTVMRKLPLPLRRIIGDLSNTERVLVGLDLRAMTASPPEQTGGSHV